MHTTIVLAVIYVIILISRAIDSTEFAMVMVLAFMIGYASMVDYMGFD